MLDVVEHVDSLAIKVMTKPVRIVFHPGKQRLGCFIWISTCGLTGFDPTTKQIIDQHAEVAARIVDLIGFFMACGDKSLELMRCSFQLFLDELLNFIRDILNIINE